MFYTRPIAGLSIPGFYSVDHERHLMLSARSVRFKGAHFAQGIIIVHHNYKLYVEIVAFLFKLTYAVFLVKIRLEGPKHIHANKPAESPHIPT